MSLSYSILKLNYSPLILNRGTQVLFSVKYLFGEESIA